MTNAIKSSTTLTVVTRITTFGSRMLPGFTSSIMRPTTIATLKTGMNGAPAIGSPPTGTRAFARFRGMSIVSSLRLRPAYVFGYMDGYAVAYNPTTQIIADVLDLATVGAHAR